MGDAEVGAKRADRVAVFVGHDARNPVGAFAVNQVAQVSGGVEGAHSTVDSGAEEEHLECKFGERRKDFRVVVGRGANSLRTRAVLGGR